MPGTRYPGSIYPGQYAGQAIAVEEDARAWRYHAQVSLDGVGAQVLLSDAHLAVAAAASASVRSVGVAATVGAIVVVASTGARVETLLVGLTLGGVGASSGARVVVAPVFAQAGVSFPAVAARIKASFATIELGVSSVVVGPDLVRLEEDELLLLLEVA
ncbi:MAG TPA: hypothetical protein VMZ92_13330 [Planctomycetota bacterium]|nr:hypothetical protein [Planctomycetota bacterium]